MLSLVAVVMSAPLKYELSVPSIMQAPLHIGRPPTNLRWSEDGRRVLFSWSKADGKEMQARKNWSVERDGSNLREEAPGDTMITRNQWDGGFPVNGKIAYISNGDIYLYDVATKSPALLLSTPETEVNPRLTADGKSVIFFRGSSLHRIGVDDKAIVRLTKSEGVEGEGVVLKTPDGGSVASIQPSANGTHASAPHFRSAETAPIANVPNYITSTGYPQMIPTYPRVGAPQPTSKNFFFDLRTGRAIEMAPVKPGTASQVQWAPNGSYAIARLNSHDHEDSWIMGFDPATNEVTTLYHEHDPTWIGGPARVLGWLPDSSRFYFVSEENGFANLYTMAPGDSKPKNITEGQFEVSNVSLDSPRNRFIFESSEGSPYRRHIAAVGFDGGERKKLAEFGAGDEATYAMSHDGSEFAVVRSPSTNRPAELFVNGRQITTTPTDEWLSGPWINAPIVEFPARDGAKVPAKLFKPKNWKRGGPAVIFIHGAGYLQNVFEGWSNYSREYMFHHVLMDKGYAVLDIDYRASAGYGKAWRTAIHRHMGGKDLDDILDGAKYLVNEHRADPKRLGVYGGSYGGFLTLMALFTSPDTFVAGAALRPVVDWAAYHHGYTAPILNTPQEDPFAYRKSSPIHHVEGLKGHLLICHGMVDTNVHFQDSVRLAQRLIELGKDNWEIAPYPVENHAFTRAESWTDEYKRILNLFERTIGNRRPR